MQKILIPTDFSFASVNAVNHAVALLKPGGTLTLLHVYHPEAGQIEFSSAFPIDDLVTERRAQLDKFKQEMHKINPETTIEHVFELGFAVDMIVETAKAGGYDAIVMGTSGDGGMLEHMLGSVSTEVSQKSPVPLWLIPPKAAPQKIGKIVYAYNGDQANEALLGKAAEIAQDLGASIDFVTVVKGESDDTFTTEILNEIVEKIATPLSYSIVTVSSDSGWQGILDHARLTGADLIVIGARKRAWYERLFHRSFTKNIILEDKDVPLLVLRTQE